MALAPTLYRFFHRQVEHGFRSHGLAEPATVDYVSDVLTRFSQTQTLYAVADRGGRPLEHVVDFLTEREAAETPDTGRADRARAKTLLKHLAEYTLFMSGFFRERLIARGELNYYQAQGAGAYGQWADYEIAPPKRALYQRLHQDFERISDTLDDMRHEQLPLACNDPTPVPADTNHLIQRAFWRI